MAGTACAREGAEMKAVVNTGAGQASASRRKAATTIGIDDLFGDTSLLGCQELAEGAVVLHGKALPWETAIRSALAGITILSPFRHMMTPGGFTMSVAMTNCGQVGWITDQTGYRYDRVDPSTGCEWPKMPGCFVDLAMAAAADAGYPDFVPDACLINKYEPGARLTLHQDKNETEFTHPIVSVSLGLPATFLFGGLKRNDPTLKVKLQHGMLSFGEVRLGCAIMAWPN